MTFEPDTKEKAIEILKGDLTIGQTIFYEIWRATDYGNKATKFYIGNNQGAVIDITYWIALALGKKRNKDGTIMIQDPHQTIRSNLSYRLFGEDNQLDIHYPM